MKRLAKVVVCGLTICLQPNAALRLSYPPTLSAGEAKDAQNGEGGHAVASKWKYDREDAFAFGEFRGMDEIKMSPGSPANLMFIGAGGMVSGRHDWSLTLEFDGMVAKEKGFMFGVTTEECFKPANELRGMMFDGFQLTDGEKKFDGYRKIDGFRPSPQNYHTIQMVVEIGDEVTKIYFVQEARPLGLAFEVPTDKKKKLFPVVHFGGGKVRALFSQQKELPEDFLTRTDPYLSPNQSMWGLWKLAPTKNADLAAIIGVNFLVEPLGSSGEVSIKTKVVNSLEATLKGTELFAVDMSGTGLGNCQTDVRKVGQEQSSEVEKSVVSFLEAITSFKAFRDITPEGSMGPEQILINGGNVVLERAKGEDTFQPISERMC